jgi:hypothetical protein
MLHFSRFENSTNSLWVPLLFNANVINNTKDMKQMLQIYMYITWHNEFGKELY